MRLRAQRHGIPGMGSRPGRVDIFGRGVPIGSRGGRRPAGLHVDVGGPVDVGEILGRQQLAGLAIENVEKSVLVRLDDDAVRGTSDVEAGENHLLRGVKIPAIAWGGLVVPSEPAGIPLQRNYRSAVEA